jgi:hypothetical protein
MALMLQDLTVVLVDLEAVQVALLLEVLLPLAAQEYFTFFTRRTL